MKLLSSFKKKSWRWWGVACLVNFVLLYLIAFSFKHSSYTVVARGQETVLGIESFGARLDLPAPYPQPRASLAEPVITASAAAIFDRDSKVFLWQKNPESLRLIASTSKIMTALVALDYYDLKDVLMVKNVSDEGQDMRLVNGELISVEALIYGLLVSSANDAAQILAQNYPGGEAAFVTAMNTKARELGMTRSVFGNPSGLDGEGRTQAEVSYSTARELAWLGDKLLSQPFLAQVVATKEMALQSPQGQYLHSLYNINQLLWTTPGVIGIKTGWTEGAGECLVSAVERDGHQLVVVVLGSRNRFEESQQLIEWAFKNYDWVSVATPE